MLKKKICIITGSRADYGLLRWVMKGIKDSEKLQLNIIVTGMHLSPEFGLTYTNIEQDGFTISKKIEMLMSSDTPVGISKSTGLGVIGFADALAEIKPDLLLLLGDRYEVLSAAISALFAQIPIAHIHGGETTEGAFDEAIRHSITKMSYLHFVATDVYRQRVIQLGEHPDRVFKVGGLGIDSIIKLPLLGRVELEKAMDFSFGAKSLLITFHPVTLEKATSAHQIKELLSALDEIKDIHLIFTLPNSDTDGRIIIQMIELFCSKHPNAKSFSSLGTLLYLSCIGQVDGVMGNSSSGLTEVPSFQKGTINIGNRQRGRIKAESVIDCEADKKSILEAIDTLYSYEFCEKLKTVINPYGDGGASERIIKILEGNPFNHDLHKQFYDLNIESHAK